MTAETSPEEVRWKNWYGDNGVGIYQHCCGGMSSMWHKPHQNCKMERLGVPFCSVCSEGTIEKIHSLVPAYQGSTPEESDLMDAAYPIEFNLDLILPIPNTLSIQWELNGTEIARDQSSITLEQSMVESGSNTLTVSIEDTTALMRLDNNRYVYGTTWTFENTSTSITDVNKENFTLNVSPNPATSYIEMTLDSGWTTDHQVMIYNGSGRLLQKIIPNQAEKLRIDISQVISGRYSIQVFKSGQFITSQPIIKN